MLLSGATADFALARLTEKDVYRALLETHATKWGLLGAGRARDSLKVVAWAGLHGFLLLQTQAEDAPQLLSSCVLLKRVGALEVTPVVLGASGTLRAAKRYFAAIAQGG